MSLTFRLCVLAFENIFEISIINKHTSSSYCSLKKYFLLPNLTQFLSIIICFIINYYKCVYYIFYSKTKCSKTPGFSKSKLISTIENYSNYNPSVFKTYNIACCLCSLALGVKFMDPFAAVSIAHNTSAPKNATENKYFHYYKNIG